MPDVRFRIIADLDASKISAEVARVRSQLAASALDPALLTSTQLAQQRGPRQSILVEQASVARAQQALIRGAGGTPDPALTLLINEAKQEYIKLNRGVANAAESAKAFAAASKATAQRILATYNVQNATTPAPLTPTSILNERESIAARVRANEHRTSLSQAAIAGEDGLLALLVREEATRRERVLVEQQLTERVRQELIQRGIIRVPTVAQEASGVAAGTRAAAEQRLAVLKATLVNEENLLTDAIEEAALREEAVALEAQINARIRQDLIRRGVIQAPPRPTAPVPLTPAQTEAKAVGAAIIAAENRAQVAQAILANDVNLLELKKQEILANREAVALEQQAAILARQQLVAEGRVSGATRTQRAQAYLANRTAGVGAPVRFADEFRTLGQLGGSTLLTTARFAASGALLYGGIQLVSELIREGNELQQTFAIVQGQIESIGPSAGVSFSQVRKEILDTAQATGVMAAQVANIQRQLAGAFADEAGVPNFARAAEETRAALELSRVTGLPEQEITDSLTAVALSFDTNFRAIGDTIIGLEQQFGVLAPEIVRFTADLAPLGNALGFTAEQLSGLGAVAQQASGRGGAELAEQLGRALSSLQQRGGDLVNLFRNSDAAGFVQPLIDALAGNDIPQVLALLAQGYDKLTDSQKNALGSLVGGRREAAAFFAILERGSQTARILSGDIDLSFTGATEKRFESLRQTVGFTFDQLQRSVERFGITLFEAGLGDALVGIGRALKVVADAAAALIGIFNDANNATNGLLVPILAITKAIQLLTAATKAQAAAQAAAAVTAVFNPAAAAAAPAAGGRFARFLNPAVAAGGLGAFLKGAPAAAGNAAIAHPFVTAAVVAAGVALYRDNAAKEIASASASFSEQVGKALQSGKSVEEVRALARKYGDRYSLRERSSTFLTGNKSLVALAEDEIQKFQTDAIASKLEAISGQVQLDIPGFQGPVDPGLLADRLRKDPTSDKLQTQAQLVLDAALKSREGLKEVFAGIDSQVAAERKVAEDAVAASEQLADPLRAADTASLLADYKAGRAGPQALTARYKEDLQFYETTIAGVKDQKGQSEFLMDLYRGRQEILDNLAELLVQSVFEPVQLRQRIREALGVPGGLEASAADYASIVDDLEEAPQQQLEAAFAGIELLRKAAEEAGKATFTIPPEFRQVIVAAQVRGSGNYQAVAEQIGVTVNELSAFMAEQIVVYGRASEEVITEIYNAEVALLGMRFFVLQTTLASAKKLGGIAGALLAATATAESAQILSEIAKLNKEHQDFLDAGGVIVPGEELPTSTDADTSDLQRRIADARIRIQQARANGDPVAIANAALESARVAARFASDDAEVLEAEAQRIEAMNQLADAQADILAAQREYTATIYRDDAVSRTEAEFNAAQEALSRAKGKAAEIRAQARRSDALHAYRDAIRDVLIAQKELAIAVAEAAGDAVEAARIELDLAVRAYNRLVQNPRAGGAEIARAKAEAVRARANLRDTELSERERAIDTALQLERITVQQAIRQLQALLEIPGLTKQQTDEILLKIKQLKDEVSGDLAFNLPDIQLPTYYEVKRLIAAGSGANGPGYQDNRVVSMQVNISSEVDAGPVLDQIAQIVGAPPISGTVPRNY